MPLPYILLSILVNVICGSGFALSKYLLVHGWPTFTTAWLRVALPGILLLPVTWKHRRAFDRHDYGILALMGVFGIAMPGWFSLASLEFTSAINASLLGSTEPVFIAILAFLILRETINAGKILGILAGFLGAAVIAAGGIPWLTTEGLSVNKGDGFAIAAAFTWAVYSILIKFMHNPRNFSGIIAVASGFVTLAFLPSLWWTDLALTKLPWTWDTLLVLSLLIGVVNIGGYYLWGVVLERVESSRFAPYINVQPVMGVLLGVLFLGEAFSWSHLAGGALVIFGMYCTTHEEPTQPAVALANPPA